jgi:hypothetical protein
MAKPPEITASFLARAYMNIITVFSKSSNK